MLQLRGVVVLGQPSIHPPGRQRARARRSGKAHGASAASCALVYWPWQGKWCESGKVSYKLLIIIQNYSLWPPRELQTLSILCVVSSTCQASVLLHHAVRVSRNTVAA